MRKPRRLVIGLAAVLVSCLFVGVSAMADTISFQGTKGTFSFGNTTSSSLVTPGASITGISDLVNSALDVSVQGGLITLTSGAAKSMCSSATCSVVFGTGGTLTLTGGVSALGIPAGTTLVTATFADGSSTFFSTGTGTFGGDLTSLTVNSMILSYFKITGARGSEAQTFTGVTFNSSKGFHGEVGTSGLTISGMTPSVPEPSSLSLFTLALIALGLVVTRRFPKKARVS